MYEERFASFTKPNKVRDQRRTTVGLGVSGSSASLGPLRPSFLAQTGPLGHLV